MSTGFNGDGKRPGRRANGQFAPGNRCSQGNPLHRQVHERRAALLAAVTPADVRKIARTLLKLATGGDIAAAKVLFDHVVGKPRDDDGAALTTADIGALVAALAAVVRTYVPADRLPRLTADLRHLQE